VWALRITSDVAGVDETPSGVKRRRLLPVAPNDQFVGYITLYSLTTVEPLAIIHDSFVQKWRVGATTALGIRELAREDVRTAGLFGSGWQAEAHLQFLMEVRPDIETVRVYSPTREHREEFAAEWTEQVDADVVAVEEPQEAVTGCGIVITATAAMDPVFDGDWIEPGTHVTCITNPDGTATRRELDDTTYDRADVLHVTSREQVHHDDQFDILGPVDRGLREWDSIREIGEVLLGDAELRTDDDQITVYANNTGMGLQFAAVCSRVLERAEEADIGHEIPTDWLLEDTTP
jgi:ornithine cyclodeaminase/alanine dehydrogenase-like protein (mu-crystallin family)